METELINSLSSNLLVDCPPQNPKIELGRINFSSWKLEPSNMRIVELHGADYYDIFTPDRNYYGWAWFLSPTTDSYIEVEIDIDRTQSNYYLDLFHLSRPSSKVTITVNGNIVVSDYCSNDYNFKLKQFDITDFVQDGKNVIRISSDENRQGDRYWIRSLAVYS